MKTISRLRRGHYLNRGAVFLLVIALTVGMAACVRGGGSGTTPTPVSTWRGLDAIRNNLRGHYVLTDDLDADTDGYDDFVLNTAGDKGWEPIGTSTRPFRGTFDGRGNTIKDLFINSPEDRAVGLFGYVDGASIKNVRLEDADVTGGYRVGILVGWSFKGVLIDCHSSGNVAGRQKDGRLGDSVGGLVGFANSGSITNSSASATVTADRYRAGGLVGHSLDGSIISCNYYGTNPTPVQAQLGAVLGLSSAPNVMGGMQVGGLVGLAHRSQVHGCSVTNLIATAGSMLGGVAGWDPGADTNGSESLNHRLELNKQMNPVALVALNEDAGDDAHLYDTAPPGWYVGGVVGLSGGTLKQCDAVGTVTGISNVGGLAGANSSEGTVEDCSAIGEVIGDSNVGGLVGMNEGTVNDSRSGGSVTGEQAVGRLVGFNSGIVSNSDSDARATRAGEDVDDLVGENTGRILHKLTVSSTDGGSVTAPGEGAFTYDAGTVVDLVAEAEEGYRFVNWTGKADAIDDVNAPSTAITMNGNYSLTANFVAARTDGFWLDRITIVKEPDGFRAVERLAAGEFDVYAHALDNAALLAIVDADPNLYYKTSARGFYPLSTRVDLAADRADGIDGSWMWAFTAHFRDTLGDPELGGDLRVAMYDLLVEPWNPIAGASTVHDMFPIRATGDMGTHPDTRDGLRWAGRIQRAEVFVQTGTPVGVTNTDWCNLSFVPEIQVPLDAWADWDATTQEFLTVQDRFGTDGTTARTKSVSYYPKDVFDIPLHDGSTLSMGDFILYTILQFDRGKQASAIFDESYLGQFDSFMQSFRGVRFVSGDPNYGLIVEYYSDEWQFDAELMVTTMFPFYAQGPGFWHPVTLGILAEQDRVLAFSQSKSDTMAVEWMSLIAGPSLPVLASRLNQAQAASYIPYEPTMGRYVSQSEAAERWSNLQKWYAAKGHFWVGSGPYCLESVYSIQKIIRLERFEDYPDARDRWLFLLEPQTQQ